jgi:rhodanese-related sulfurtransferase
MIEQIRPNALAEWLMNNQGEKPVVVLDVREPAEWRTASVKEGDFTLVQMSMGSVPARVQELDPQLPIAILCHHGGRSMQVAQFLMGRGFAQVANIAGGIDAWAMEVDNSIPRY